MKKIYIATVTLSCSETDSLGRQTETQPVHIVPVWAHEEDDARCQIEQHYADDCHGSPGNWMRVTEIKLQGAIGTP